jgi:hypothetical protein
MKLVLLIVLIILSSLSLAQTLCQTWTETRAGNLDTNFLDEASGMAASNLVENRLYHTNDTWTPSPNFFITDTAGQNLQTVMIEGVSNNPRINDIEDMDVGKCGDSSCLFIGDIGDNRANRPNINILVLEELTDVASSVRVKQYLRVQYPDEPHDSESLGVHPNGDIYVLTKEITSILGTAPAKLYRLARDLWENAGDEVLTLEFVANVNLFALSGTTVNIFSHLATGMDISNDGQRLLILTYGEVFEIAVDVSQLNGETLSTKTPYKQIEVVTLLQQESISYSSDSHSFFYTAEARSGSAPLMLETCSE